MLSSLFFCFSLCHLFIHVLLLALYFPLCVCVFPEMGREKQPCVELAHHRKAPLISQTDFKKRHIYTYICDPEKSYYRGRACQIVKSLSVPSRKCFPQYYGLVVTSLFQTPPYNVAKTDSFINLLWAFSLKLPFSAPYFPQEKLMCFYIT